jgi:hypothetical protein
MNKRWIGSVVLTLVLLPLTFVGAIACVMAQAYLKGYYLMENTLDTWEKWLDGGNK